MPLMQRKVECIICKAMFYSDSRKDIMKNFSKIWLKTFRIVAGEPDNPFILVKMVSDDDSKKLKWNNVQLGICANLVSAAPK